MSVKMKIKADARKVMVEMPNHLKRHREGIRQALYEHGQDVVDETRRLIRRRNKTGRLYRFRGNLHRASAPGEAPANRSGRLLKSSDYRVASWYRMEVGEEEEYAEFLESGTKKMAPRPHLRVAVNNMAQNLLTLLPEFVDKEIKK